MIVVTFTPLKPDAGRTITREIEGSMSVVREKAQGLSQAYANQWDCLCVASYMSEQITCAYPEKDGA